MVVQNRAVCYSERSKYFYFDSFKMNIISTDTEAQSKNFNGVYHKLQRKIRRHKNAIIATITNGISNARIEATNNKIKLSVRMAYGFRNIDNLISMIMLRCGGLNIGLPGRAQRI